MQKKLLLEKSCRLNSYPMVLFLALLALLAGAFRANAQALNQWNTTTTPSSWATAGNWSLGVVPGVNDTAAFTNLDITADTTVTLDANESINTLVFGDLVTSTAGSWLINTGALANATLTLSGTAPSITVNTLGTGKSVQINAPVAGSSSIAFNGPGQVFLNNPSSWTGGALINGGSVGLGGAIGTIGQAGYGVITLTNGGTLYLNGYNSATQAGNFTNNIIVPAGTTGTLYAPGRGGYGVNAAITVHGTLNLVSCYVRSTPNGDWSASDGQINITGTASGTAAGGDIYLNTTGNFSFGTAAMNFGTAAGSLYSSGNFTTSGINITIGEVSGTTGGLIGGSASVANNRITTFVVGGRNTTATFAGTIRDNSRPAAITKMGTGAWNLAAANNYSGATLISTGAIYGVTGGSISNSIITVATNLTYGTATFGVQLASTGGQWTGTNLVLRSGSTLAFNYGTLVASTNTAPLRLLGGITATNVVFVSVSGGSGWAPGIYPLARYASNYVGNGFAAFVVTNLPLRVVGVLSNNTANNGIDLVVTAVNEPVKWAVGNGAWDINVSSNWKDATGTSTTYQQLLGLGDQVVLDDTASGASPIAITVGATVTPASLTVSNSAKAYSLSGPAGIAGTTGLTKQGAGILTIATTNTFSGPVNLNGGVLNFSSLSNNLGTGTVINFNGGTLQYAAGSADDISTRTVTISTNGATIDTGASSVTFSNRIGNNGSGSLTKLGAGKLTLVTNSTFTGLTLIQNGTLALGTSLSNSAGLVVSAGAKLDASLSGLNLNGANGQVLAGSGTVAGNVTTASGAVITPGTNGAVATLTLQSDLNLNGGTYFFDVATTNRDLIIVAGALNIQNPAGGTLTINPLNILTNGTYKLIQYAGSYNGGVTGLTVAGAQVGKIFTLSDATAGEIDLVVSSGGSATLKWLGDGANNFWDINSTANWLNGGSPADFINGDTVAFDDTGSLSPNVNIESTPVSPSSMVVNTINTYTINGYKITGSGTSITKNNTGTLILANAGNDYGGVTTISGGTLQIGDGSTAGTAIGVGNILNNGTLIFDQPDSSTVAGNITGTGPLTVNGTGSLTLLGNNTYGGLTTVDYGTLSVGNGGLTGSLGANAVSLLDGSTLTINRAGSYSLLNGISGNGEVAFGGPGTVTFGGVNTYLNNTIITNGTVILAANNTIPSGGSTTGWLILDGGATAGVLNLNGHNQAVNELSGLAGTALGLIVNNGSGLNTLTIGTAATTTYAGLIQDNNNAGTGQIGLEIDGDGTAGTALTLSGLNSYSGPVIVNGGKVVLGNNGGQTAIGTGPITLENNGTVQMAYYGSGATTQGTFVNSVLVPAGTTGNLFTMGRGTYSGNLTVHGTLNLTTSYARSNPSGDWSASDGQINILAGTGGGNVYLNNAGNITFGIAAINLGTGVTIINHANTGTAGNTITIGELTGSGTIEDTDAGFAGRTTTYVVGGRNTDATFNGTIQNATRYTGINKVGTKSWTLAGTDTYTGATTVTSGSLIIGSGSFPAASTSFTVYSGALLDVSSYGGLTFSASQTLAGGGSVSGGVTLITGDILNPGVGTAAGTLAFLNGLTESGPYVTNNFNLSSDSTGVSLTNSTVAVTGDLTFTGTNLVVINPLNTILGAGTYTLFTYTGNLINEGGVVAAGTTLENNLVGFGPFATNSDVTLIFSNAVHAVVLIVKPTGQSLTWQGGVTGTITNNWDVNISSNWLNAATSLTNFLTYDSVSFGDGSTNFNVVLAGALAPGAVTVNSTNAYTFAGTGKITGPTGISKAGTNVLTISNTGGNDFTGQVLVNGGTLKLGVATALGATNGNTVVASGATLDLNGFAPNAEPVVAQGGGVNGTGAIINNGAQLVNAGFTGNVMLAGDTTFGGSNRWDIYNGSLTGNGHNLTKVGANYIVLTSLGDIGVNNISVQSGYFTLIGNTTLGTNGGTVSLLSGSRIDLYATSVTNAKPVVMSGATISSSSGTNVYGGPITLGASETFTATTPLVLNGALAGAGSLLKNGASTLTLFGTNTYSGATTVAAGSLLLAGTSSIASSTLLDVNAGAILDVTGLSGASLSLSSGTTLKGAGSVNGSVTAAAGSTVAPGESVVGTLTVSNTVTLAGNALLALNKGLAVSNSVLAATTIHYGGTLTITNLGAALAAGDSFKLFSAGTITGAFTAILPATPGAGLLWNTNGLATGTLAVLAGATVNTNPPPLLTTINGSQFILSWPTNLGWTLQAQTNNLSTGLSGNWVSQSGSTSVTSVTNTIDPTKGTVFYRLVYTNTP